MDMEPTHCEQTTANGELRHLLTLEGLDLNTVEKLLDHAEAYLRPVGEKPARDDLLAGRTVANLFFEPSTRTRAAFELAAKRMSADVLNLDVNTSSRIKGESILDTIYTLQAMQADVFVVRDASAGIPAMIANHVHPHISVLNAGEANVSHPTQGLLDLMTIRQYKKSFAGLSVTIVGDIAHSRVARSACQGLQIMGVTDIRLVAPGLLQPQPDAYANVSCSDNLDTALDGADVVMALRIQRERLGHKAQLMSNEDYRDSFGLTTERLSRAKPDAIVMHPGPMNRDVEIADEVADGPQSVIAQQVTNGLAIRMAILATVTASLNR